MQIANKIRILCLQSYQVIRHRSKKTSELRVTGLCEGNSPVTGEFPAQRAGNAENVSIWWRHHGYENTFRIAGHYCHQWIPLAKRQQCRGLVCLVVNRSRLSKKQFGFPVIWDATRRRCRQWRKMMTLSNGNIFRVTGPLCREFTGNRCIPLTKASDAELWCFLWSVR